MAQQAKLIVNSVGAISALIVVGWIGYSAFQNEEIAVCDGRYPTSTRFSLASSSGESATLSELQARIGSTEWGILQNGRVLESEAGTGTHVLGVTLGKGTSSGYQPDRTRGGIGFSWTPSDMADAHPKAACLSYRVFLPSNFQFSRGGTLPGLMIGADFSPRGEPIVGDGAAVRAGWSADGRIVVNVQYATRDGWKNPSAISAKTVWPSGRWFNVEQEVILNEAGKKNGIIRLWLDGELAGENTTVALRGDDALAMAGVIADVHYGSVFNNATAPEDTEIRVSPFIIRWQ
ncbi:MAG: hypothetical protein K2Q28_08735 [Hyphomicrobium sp.]|nr:hypothetical protein [Hyphomicrobium sp.]